MIFNINPAKSKKPPALDNSYPKDVTVVCGNDAVFNAAVEEDGYPTEYTYQWYVNGSKVNGATKSTYTRDTSSDKGVYEVYCEITNKAGTMRTRTAKMTVNKAPVLQGGYPADVSVDVTGSATFTVKVSDAGYPSTLSYQWYVNDRAISGATKTSYTVSNAQKGTTSVYCKVSNGLLSTNSRTAKLVANKLYIPGSAVLSAHAYEGDDLSERFSYGPLYLTDYSIISVSVDCGTSNAKIFVSRTKDDCENYDASWETQSSGQQTATIDVSGLSGYYYIVMRVYAYWNTSGTTTFSNMVLS